jgi:hypothetical protein
MDIAQVDSKTWDIGVTKPSSSYTTQALKKNSNKG